jgi:hypothetical protein
VNTSSSTAPATIQLHKGSLYGLLAVVAALAAGITSLLLVFAVNTGSPGVRGARQAAPSHSMIDQDYVKGVTSMTRIEQAAAFGGPGGVLDALGLSAADKQYVQGVTSMTQGQQAAAYGR